MEQKMPMRDRFWKELTVEEKIERMRLEVLKERQKNKKLDISLRELKAKFSLHQHHDNNIMFPLDRGYGANDAELEAYDFNRNKNPDEFYF